MTPRGAALPLRWALPVTRVRPPAAGLPEGLPEPESLRRRLLATLPLSHRQVFPCIVVRYFFLVSNQFAGADGGQQFEATMIPMSISTLFMLICVHLMHSRGTFF